LKASSIWSACRRLVADPPPADIFEVSGRAIAAAHRNGGDPELKRAELAGGVLRVTPLEDNVADQAAFQAAVNLVSGPPAGTRKRPAALVLPDYSARISVLDFQTFPGSAAEQAMLVRFRMKKTVPFDIDAAALSFHPQPAAGGRVDVVAALMPLEILARYEAPFRAAGFQVGLVVPSLFAALRLVKPGGISVLVKLSGRVLTVAVIEESAVRLVRCVELEQVTEPEVSAVLEPTFVYVEDRLGKRADRVVMCGFGGRGEKWSAGWGIPAETLRAPHGAAGEGDAGLLGLLEGEAA
jgi:type IV pilus assembly protein PilM